MVAHVTTVVFQGISPLKVDVQVQMASGLPGLTIVGLPNKAVTESRERVRAALSALGLALPAKRITINLAPADLLKEGSHFDLPIALCLLVAMNVISEEMVANMIAMGELGLDGTLMPVSGILPAAVYAGTHKMGIVCPESQGGEAAWAGNFPILAAKTLLHLINHFKGHQLLTTPRPASIVARQAYPDLADIKGQETAKRALEITAAGGHNLLMIGPPGTGKSMLASCLPGILPRLDTSEIIEVSMIHSIAGLMTEQGLVTNRPFRDPHHSASLQALIGGSARAPEKFPSVTLAFCFWMNFQSFKAKFWKPCVNLLKQERPPSHVPMLM